MKKDNIPRWADHNRENKMKINPEILKQITLGLSLVGSIQATETFSKINTIEINQQNIENAAMKVASLKTNMSSDYIGFQNVGFIRSLN